MTKKATQLSDTREEQEAILAFIRLRIRVLDCALCCTNELHTVEEFIMHRAEIIERQPGKLGKKPKWVKKDFDALGIP